MLKLGRLTKVKVLFLVLVFVFNFDLFKFSAAILEKGLLIIEPFTQKTLRRGCVVFGEQKTKSEMAKLL